MNKIVIPSAHPRANSLLIRERLIEHFEKGIVSDAGLFAHGRGEAFDYLLGERTTENALVAVTAAAAALLTGKHPVISVNGNAAALGAEGIVRLAKVTGALIEVNLFYRSAQRERAIERLLKSAGAQKVYGVNQAASARIAEIGGERRRVDPRGILKADVVLVPLEDGDRAEALAKMGKKVITIDLNPLSRTAQFATITIVDNIVRALPALAIAAEQLSKKRQHRLKRIQSDFDNKKNLSEAIRLINNRLSKLAKNGIYISIH